jgi:integrase
MVLDRAGHGIGYVALNDARIKAAKAKDRAYKLGDSGQLYLMVSSTGQKLWRMNYSVRPTPGAKPRQKTLSFGAYPAVTLVEARKRRDEAKDMLRQGVDPSVQRKVDTLANTLAQSNTFESLARAWWAKQRPRWSSVHAADVITSLEQNIFPEIGDLPITAIKAPKLLEVLTAVEARGAIETAHRLRARCSSVFVFAIASGLADADPAASLGKALSPVPRSKPQPALIELKAVQQMLLDAEAERCRALTKLALRFLALTAVRPGELRFAAWAEFEDLDGAEPLWRIPAARMKGDDDRKAEVGGDHLVPLSRQAVEVLVVARRLSSDLALVFPGERHPHKPISENTLRALLIRAGYFQRHVPHGFRAAFSTIMNEKVEREWRAAGNSGGSPDRQIIDLMLAHVPKDKVEGAYNRASFMPRRREIAQDWADMLVADFWPPEIHLGQPIRYAATGPGRT